MYIGRKCLDFNDRTSSIDNFDNRNGFDNNDDVRIIALLWAPFPVVTVMLRMNVWAVAICAVAKVAIVKTIVVVTVTVLVIMVAIDVTGLRE